MIRLRGYALIELIVAIVVIAIAVTSVLSVLSASAIHSSEALVRQQATMIASAYLEEVRSQSFVPGPGNTRATYDDVQDYNGLSNAGAVDQKGVAVPGLGAYLVAVAVTPAALVTVPASESFRIDVTVTHPSGVTVKLTGYRMQLP